MTAWLRKAGAFILRDFRIESGYTVSFLMRLFESMAILVFFYFLSKLITPQSTSSLAGFSGRYFPFAVIGVAFARYFDLTLRMFSESIRQAQVTGCLDAMLSSQTGCVTVVLMSSLYGLISGAVQLLLILVAAAFAFGVDFSRMDVLATLLVLFSPLVSSWLLEFSLPPPSSGSEGLPHHMDPRRFRQHPRRRLLPHPGAAALGAKGLHADSHHLFSRRAAADHAQRRVGDHGGETDRDPRGDRGHSHSSQRHPLCRSRPERPQRGNTDAVLGSSPWTPQICCRRLLKRQVP